MTRLVNWLAEFHPDIPVIVVTGYPGVQREYTGDDVIDVFRKPMDARALLDAIEQILLIPPESL